MRVRYVAAWLLAAAALLAVAVPAPAAAQVQPYGTNNYGTFYNVLPPGTNGLDNALALAVYEATGARPAHNNDQLGMYSSLTTAAPNIQASQISSFFKDATFGVPSGQVAGTESPEPGVTIERDARFGVPHIYGDTRAELMFGIGYATAEDRLFFIDALRHAGQGDLASFAGGANAPMDESVWASSPYTQQDLVNQVNEGIANLPDGHQILSDATNYVAGINAYIGQAQLDPLLMPGEYAAIGQLGGPAPFTVEDLVSIASLVGGIFGQGGGAQLSNAVLYENLTQRFGRERRAVPGSPQGVRGVSAVAAAAKTGQRRTPKTGQGRTRKTGHGRTPKPRHRKAHPTADHSGFATLMSFVDPSDPEAPTTEKGKSFPYQTLPLPKKTARGSIALPDPGSVSYVDHVAAGAIPPGAPPAQGLARGKRAAGRIGVALGAAGNAGPGLFAFPPTDSNALLVSGAHTVSGHPIAVMGPQVSYFSPEILMEEDIHGPGIDADGAAFPGVNLYVELGHGPDYAWSATSAGQNIIDTFAAPLCNPNGGTV
ncbi:MAG TPA: penicillin acylase family protein, partial [Solirubrobacteraceae bacterium]|nr:penicillin acylase family protein [Solirubrobacteraceae bacterium]